MKESDFNRKLVEFCVHDTMAQYNFLKKFNKNILSAYDSDDTSLERKWKPFNPLNNNNLESGVYLTLRCSYSGIYQCYNIWDAKQRIGKLRLLTVVYHYV